MVFLCRLCGKCENDASGVAIFGEQGVKDNLSYKIKLSLDISQSDATGINLEQLSSSTGQEINVVIGEQNIHSIENSIVPCKTEEPCSSKGSGEIYIKRPDNVIIGVANILPLPNSIVVPQESCSMQPVIPTLFQSSGIQNSPQLQTQLAFVGDPFQLQTVISNGIIQEFLVPVGDKAKENPKTRKPKQTSTNKQRKSQTLPNANEIVPNQESNLPTTSFVGKLTVVGQEVNNSVVHVHSSAGVQSHEVTVPKIVGSCTNESIRNLSGTLSLEREQNCTEKNVTFIGPDLEVQENTEKSDVYIGPDLETPVSATLSDAVTREQSSQQVDKHIQEDNSLKILDVFTVQETSSTDTAETPDISGTGNWHSPLADASMSSTVSSRSFNTINSSNKSANQWHSPSPSSPLEVISESTSTPLARKRKKTDLISESVKSSISLDEEDEEEDDEDDILVVEIVKANKGSIAKHWEKFQSEFRCKLCKKTYKKLVKCENHIRIHLGIKPYECHICKRRYHKKRLLNEHCCEHIGKKLYQCMDCDKSFRYRKNFKTHLESHVESENSNYCCEICGRGFSSQFEYWSHKTSKHIIEELRTVVVE